MTDDAAAPEVEVVIEVPRGSFLKRGSTGRIDFVSPLPCPFNYGAVPALIGLEGDLLDALVLGPRLVFGARLRVRAWGAVTLIDRGMADDKLVCCERPIDATIAPVAAGGVLGRTRTRSPSSAMVPGGGIPNTLGRGRIYGRRDRHHRDARHAHPPSPSDAR